MMLQIDIEVMDFEILYIAVNSKYVLLDVLEHELIYWDKRKWIEK